MLVNINWMQKFVSEKENNPLTQEEMLHLIECGDIVELLSEENMKGFNDLIKYELIVVKDDKIYLSELGKEAKLNGVKNTVARQRVKILAANIPSRIPLRISKLYLIISLLSLLLALLFLIFNIVESTI